MSNKKFWMTVGEWVHDSSPTMPRNNQQTICVAPSTTIKRARWFPAMLHSIRFGKLTLFEIIAGSEEDLGPNQKELKSWVAEQSFRKHQSLKVPVFAGVNRYATKEELAGLIMNHLVLGSSHKMIFLPALPMEYHSKRSLPNRLSPKELVPVRFPAL